MSTGPGCDVKGTSAVGDSLCRAVEGQRHHVAGRLGLEHGADVIEIGDLLAVDGNDNIALGDILAGQLTGRVNGPDIDADRDAVDL